MEIIKIKCPNCGSVLKVEDKPENAAKMLTCPVCHTRDSFTNYKRLKEEPRSDETLMNRTVLDYPGKLTDLATGMEYILKIGQNTLGRKVNGAMSKASIPVDTDDMGVSREHALIDVVAGRDGKFHTYISNLKNKNATCINSEILKFGDKIALQDGDTISTSKLVLRFNSGNQHSCGDENAE